MSLNAIGDVNRNKEQCRVNFFERNEKEILYFCLFLSLAIYCEIRIVKSIREFSFNLIDPYRNAWEATGLTIAIIGIARNIFNINENEKKHHYHM